MKKPIVLPEEKTIGINTFFTDTTGINGKIKVNPEDFEVLEKSNYPPEKKDAKFVIAEITSTNWETNNLVRELSHHLHISRKRINFAGTKDKRAKTKQLISIYKAKKEDVSKIKIKDVEITNIYYSDKPVKIGNLIGNSFKIKIRNISKNINQNQLEKTIKQIQENGGFPNFYGIQRFGIIRPITHLVGKYLVKGDFEKAVMTYIANPLEKEPKETYDLRKKLQKTKDYKEAFNTYPKSLNFEKAMLNRLIQDENDFVGALKELPSNLLSMFIYAYQSYLFNKMLSIRIDNKIPINQAIEGDIILPVRPGIVSNENIIVTNENLKKVNFQISKGRAFVSGVLFGCESTFSDGIMGEIERKIINSEKIDHRDFIIPEIPFISSSGSRRALLSPVSKLSYKICSDKEKDLSVELNFDLNKGSYATCLLREIMKADDITNY